MNPKSILLILLAVISVTIVAILTRSFLTGQQQPQQQVVELTETRILVAKRDLPVGTLINPSDYELLAWPQNGISDAYIVEGKEPDNLTGQVVRHPISQGEPMTLSSLVAPGERGFLAAALQPGMRAATVQVSPTAGVGGFIFPGDRVDVILTHELPGEQKNKTQVAETVLQNVRILGIDQKSSVDDNVARLSKTVTLEVTPKMAEKIALLPKLGILSLSLRSLARNVEDPMADSKAPPIDKIKTHTFGAEISNLLAAPDKKEARQEIRIARGNNVEVLEFERSRKQED